MKWVKLLIIFSATKSWEKDLKFNQTSLHIDIFYDICLVLIFNLFDTMPPKKKTNKPNEEVAEKAPVR